MDWISRNWRQFQYVKFQFWTGGTCYQLEIEILETFKILNTILETSAFIEDRVMKNAVFFNLNYY